MQDIKSTNKQEVSRTGSMSNAKLALIITSPVLIPIALAAVVLFFMFIACGWFFVAMTFFTSVASAAIGIVGIIGTFFNVANGIGAVLLMLGVGLGSLGFIYPTFIIGREMSKGFLILHRELMAKGVEIKEKLLKGLREI